MAQVLCTLPHAGASINGVCFAANADGAMVSEDIDDDVAEAFCAIPGYCLAGEGGPAPEEMSVAEAIAHLQPGVDEEWTADGRPDANALSALCGRRVTAKERDGAWAAYQDG